MRNVSTLTYLLVFATLCLSTSPCVIAQDTVKEPASPSSELPLSSKDPDEIRARNIAQFIDAHVACRMTQRFEMYCPHSEEELRKLKSMGFTQVILDRVELHEMATRIGLKVVLGNWWSHQTTPDEIERGLLWARAVDPKTLVGFSVQDEPERNTPETHFDFYVDLYKRLKPVFRKEFPTTRIEISHWGPMAALTDAQLQYYSLLYNAADVMRIMPYPDIHEAPLDDVFFIMQRSRKIMTLADRQLPLVVILQTWIHPPKSKLPEIDELRVMAYQAMLAGAETLSFFDFNQQVWNQTPGFSDRFAELMAELTSLSERYREHEIDTYITQNGIVKSTLTSSTGEVSRIELNTHRHAVGGFGPLEVREVTSGLPDGR
ncbi:hypothetical protein [Aporhodopirellula aestuarii]|uniref:Secreted protein n=1 Tax=Aporhodopirellula aestuarii TaxID=2950107 RepID=A0ABT0UC88_9BACT|nr:hypothetical protein [Aporhodopirellula aestuarii]MCM2374644.1 hypothetical protein [Aporhodopirellula aestuarii]